MNRTPVLFLHTLSHIDERNRMLSVIRDTRKYSDKETYESLCDYIPRLLPDSELKKIKKILTAVMKYRPALYGKMGNSIQIE